MDKKWVVLFEVGDAHRNGRDHIVGMVPLDGPFEDFDIAFRIFEGEVARFTNELGKPWDTLTRVAEYTYRYENRDNVVFRFRLVHMTYIEYILIVRGK